MYVDLMGTEKNIINARGEFVDAWDTYKHLENEIYWNNLPKWTTARADYSKFDFHFSRLSQEEQVQQL